MKTAIFAALNIVIPVSAITTTATLLNNHKVELTVLDASVKAMKLVNGNEKEICKNIENEKDKKWCEAKVKVITEK